RHPGRAALFPWPQGRGHDAAQRGGCDGAEGAGGAVGTERRPRSLRTWPACELSKRGEFSFAALFAQRARHRASGGYVGQALNNDCSDVTRALPVVPTAKMMA